MGQLQTAFVIVPFIQCLCPPGRRHCVHRPRAVKSAGKIHKAPAASAAAADGAGAAEDGESDAPVLPPQKKARHEKDS